MGYANGYVRIYMPNHPHANISGMVYEHVLVAEKKLGRYLTAEEVVHHIDHNRSNNNPDNLMIFKTKKDHSIFHMNEEDFTLCIFNIDGTVSCKSNPLKINHCVRCGCVIYPGATLCRECYRKEGRDGRPKRETLKNLIRLFPFEQIGRQFNVTGNCIKNWCKYYNLPFKSSDIKNYTNEEWLMV